jgi:hypothetical protein
LKQNVKPEAWRAVPGYEGYYEASTLGRVRSLDRRDNRGQYRKGRILKTYNRGGYQKFTLWKNGIGWQPKLHTLIAITFHGDYRDQGLIVRHGPNGKTDNSPDNLSWGTHSDNEYDKERDGTSAKLNQTHCPNNHPLKVPNLVANRKHRACLTCSRAKAYHKLHPEINVQHLYALYYRKIMN